MRRALMIVLAGLGLLVPAIGASARAPRAPTRYSLAGRCWAVTGGGGVLRAVPLRFQATALGHYLLVRRDGSVLALSGGGAEFVATPSPQAEWVARRARRGRITLRALTASGRALTSAGRLAPRASLRLRRARGCATIPDAALGARGRPRAAATSYGRVFGLLEGHMHWMSFQYFGGRFHCGRPWHPYGIRYALPDCSDIEGPQGTAAPFQNFLNYGNPSQAHDTRGYPQMTSFSKDNLTYEGTYWRWIERSYLAGLRLMVMGVNENRILCQLQQTRTESCNEMDTVRRGFKALHQMEDYVDAQAGGPGKGFFQIVTTPEQARRVINQGRMAVVEEIEISEPFDCSNVGHPTCDRAQVDRQLDEVHRLGVRSMLLLNKFDNPLTGVRFDSGPVGAVINSANKQSAGSFWSAKTCTGPLHDNTIYQPEPTAAAGLAALLNAAGLGGGIAPAYPPAPHCNTRGLTPLGRHVVDRMMDLKMIVNPDHMSQAAVSSTLDELEKRRYSGVISPHGWMDPGNWPRLWKLGGLAFPGHSSAQSYVADWRRYRPRQTPYMFGWGYGADLGGLSHQPDLKGGTKLRYPFKSFDGRVTFVRQKTGLRTFDYTKEGVAHYGLYADWFADLRRQGGRHLTRDLNDGAEAYLEMWERATGIPAPGCSAATGTVGPRGLRALRLGLRWPTLLRRAGQPQARGRAWSWCVSGRGNAQTADVAELDRGGRVELAGSTARGRRLAGARGVVVGHRTRARGLSVRRSRGVTRVIAAARGRVVAVAVASPRLALHPRTLRSAMLRLLEARASQAPRRFVPSTATASAASAGRLEGHPLAGSGNARLNRALLRLCILQAGH